MGSGKDCTTFLYLLLKQGKSICNRRGFRFRVFFCFSCFVFFVVLWFFIVRDSYKYNFSIPSCCCFIFVPQPTLGGGGIMFSGHAAGRPSVVRCRPLTPISPTLSGRISTKLDTNIRHAIGHWWIGFFRSEVRGQGHDQTNWWRHTFRRGEGPQGWLVQCFKNNLLFCTDCRITDRLTMMRMITTTMLTFKRESSVTPMKYWLYTGTRYTT